MNLRTCFKSLGGAFSYSAPGGTLHPTMENRPVFKEEILRLEILA
jgi:hypothetical protein